MFRFQLVSVFILFTFYIQLSISNCDF